MTATTVKGTQITNIEALPITPLDRKIYDNHLKVSVGHIAAATTSLDEAADIMLLALIPSNAIVDGVYLKCDDLDSGATPALAVDVGVYYSGIGGRQKLDGRVSGDAVDVDVFATAITTLQAAAVTWTDITNEALNIDKYGTEIWSAAGLSSDPGGFFYVGLKVTTQAATAAAGDIVLKVEYR